MTCITVSSVATVLDDLVGALLLGLALAVDRRVGDIAERDARLAAEPAPDGSRQVEEQRLAGEEQRHPLVVADVVAPHVRRSAGLLVERQVVRVRRPAVLHRTSSHNVVVFSLNRDNVYLTTKKFVHSVLRRCWLGGRKGIRPVKTE